MTFDGNKNLSTSTIEVKDMVKKIKNKRYSKNDFQAQKAYRKLLLSALTGALFELAGKMSLDANITIKCNIKSCTMTMKTL